MNRQDRDRHDYGRYEGYNDDERYHSARNLTDEFEKEYQRDRGYSNNDIDRNRMPHSYHEGSDIEDTYQRQRRDNDTYSRRSDYNRYDRDSDRSNSSSYGSTRRTSNNLNDYRESTGRYNSDRDRYQDSSNRSLRSDNSGQYNPYNSDNYSRTREQQGRDTDSGDGYRGTRYGGNSEYLRDQQSSSYRNSDRDYRGGTSYSGPYGSDEDTRYRKDRDRDRDNDDSWFGSHQRNRYY